MKEQRDKNFESNTKNLYLKSVCLDLNVVLIIDYASSFSFLP